MFPVWGSFSFSEFGISLQSLVDDGIVQSGYAAYTGASELKDGAIRVFPWKRFLRELAEGDILG